MICPNQPLHCDAYSRWGSTGEPLTWYISQPAKWGPLTSHRSRLPSEVRTNAPLRVPTRTRTPLIRYSSLSFAPAFARTFFTRCKAPAGESCQIGEGAATHVGDGTRSGPPSPVAAFARTRA